jgi:hypothetical protein
MNVKELRKLIKEEISRVVNESNLNKEDQLNEAIKIVSSTGDKSSVDTTLIDKLISQIGPATGYTDWKERSKRVDYADIIQKVAKSFLGLGAMQDTNITVKK